MNLWRWHQTVKERQMNATHVFLAKIELIQFSNLHTSSEIIDPILTKFSLT